jgi:transcriptional regulator
MHIQTSFAETRLDVLHALIRSHPLGAFVVGGPEGIEVNHLPFIINAAATSHGVLQGHLPKANPLWQMALNHEVVVIFQGPDAYISPSWYPSKHEHGKAVPTWNYAIVHAYGTVRFVRDRAWLLNHVTMLTCQQEAAMAEPWQVSDAPADYLDTMLGNIVGVEITVTRLIGKWKVSQNRRPADRHGVVRGLHALQTERAAAMAALVMDKADD